MEQQTFEIFHNYHFYQFKYPWNYPTNICEEISNIAIKIIQNENENLNNAVKKAKQIYFSKYWN
jgi:hypothetical protein